MCRPSFNLHTVVRFSPYIRSHSHPGVSRCLIQGTLGTETSLFSLAPRDQPCDQVEQGADEKSLKSPSLPSNEQSVPWTPSTRQHGSSPTHTRINASRGHTNTFNGKKSRGSGPKSHLPLSNFKRSPGVLAWRMKRKLMCVSTCVVWEENQLVGPDRVPSSKSLLVYLSSSALYLRPKEKAMEC